mgnify:CR=1 FL=1
MKRVNLDNTTLEHFRILVHSVRAGGKTHLAGDFLNYEKQFGDVAFLSIEGEGLMTIKGIGLGNVGYVIETLKDLKELTAEFAKKPLQAIALDSLQVLERIIKLHVVGTLDKSPSSTKETNQWVDLQREFENILLGLGRSAKFIMCTCPSAINADNITNNPRLISPDLTGQRALGCAGYFEYVGYIKTMQTGKGVSKRSIQFASDGVTLVRQQTPNEIIEDIQLPQGAGGWLVIKQRIEKGLINGT